MAEYELDARGLVCPEPLMRVRNRIRELETGDRLRVRATDPSTRRDLTNFCRFMGHVLEESHEESQEAVRIYHFCIRKAAA